VATTQLHREYPVKKYVKDGRVAVIYNDSYGTGWYSWHEIEELLFDPKLVEFVLDQEYNQIPEYLRSYWPENVMYNSYTYQSLKVCWLPQNTPFMVLEYDGQETIVTKESIKWIQA
jgi:hypothetical protein